MCQEPSMSFAKILWWQSLLKEFSLWSYDNRMLVMGKKYTEINSFSYISSKDKKKKSSEIEFWRSKENTASESSWNTYKGKDSCRMAEHLPQSV